MAEEKVFDPTDEAQQLRMVEALLFAAEEPLDEKSLAARLPDELETSILIQQKIDDYYARGGQ